MDETARRQRADRAEPDPVSNVVTEDEAVFWMQEKYTLKPRKWYTPLNWIWLLPLCVFFLLAFHAAPTYHADKLSTAEAKGNDSGDTPLDTSAHNDLRERDEGSAHLASEPDDALDTSDHNALRERDEGSAHLASEPAPTLKMQVWGWIDWLFVWTICSIVYGGTAILLIHEGLIIAGLAPRPNLTEDSAADADLMTLMCYQGVLVAACAQRVFMQAVVYETSTALAKRLVVIHVFIVVIIALLVARGVVFFVDAWRRIDELVQLSNIRLQKLHSVQIQQDRPLSEVLVEGAIRSVIYPTLLLLIHLVLGCGGLRVYPWSACFTPHIVSSFVCMVYEYPKIYVDILIGRLHIKTQLRPPWRWVCEVQYSVITALLIAICCPDEVTMVSLAHQGVRAVKAEHFSAAKAEHLPAWPLKVLVAFFFAITEQTIVHDAGVDSMVTGVWWMASWLWFVLVWLVCCAALTLSTLLCCTVSLQWFHDRYAFDATLGMLIDHYYLPNGSAMTFLLLSIVLTCGGLRRCEFESWYSWAIAIDVVVYITVFISYLLDCGFVTTSPRMRFRWLGVERTLQIVSDAMDSAFYIRFAINTLFLFPGTLIARTWRPELAHYLEVSLSLLLLVQEYPTFHFANYLLRQRAHERSPSDVTFDRLFFLLAWLSVAIEFPQLFALCQGLRLVCTFWDIARWGPPAMEAVTTAREEKDAAIAETEALRCRVAEMATESTRLREDAEFGNATCRQLIAKQSEAVATAREEKDAARAETEFIRCRVAEMVTESTRLREDAEIKEIKVATNMRLITKQSQALKTAHEENEALRQHITETAKDYAKLRRALNAASDQRDTERQESAAVTHGTVELRRTIAEMTAEIRRAADAADAASVQRDAARAETETSLRAIAEKTAEIAGLREAAVIAQKVIADMKAAERQKDQTPQVANAPDADAVADILRCIGIERHAALFAEHEVDSETLFLLETDDLKEIGLPFGAVVKLRKWMARNAKDASPPTAEAANDSECVVCMERKPVQCALVPCGHLSVCLECSGGLAACPICRHGVERVLAVFPP